MASIKGILFALMGIYLLTLIVVYQNRRVNRELPAEIEPAELEFLKANSNHIDLPYGKLYDFINKSLAYNILSQLDVYKPLTDEQRAQFGVPFKYDQAFAGFKSDDKYCEKHRAYFVQYPEFVFQDMNVVQARETDSFVTERIITGFANDIHPNNNDNLPASLWYKPTTEIKPYVNGFFTNNALYAHLRLGKHFSCLAQVSNHIPGNVFISRKDYVAQSAASYMKLYANRPQCLSYDKFFPETWNLADKEECGKFFEIFNSEEYKRLQEERRIVYIKKVSGLHRGEGVEPLIPKEEVILRNEYDNGAKCGTNTANVIIQHYIHNPLLLSGRKFDFRMYLLIASTNPLIAYYHDGNLRVSLGTYTSDSDDKKTLLTNIALNQEIYDNAKDGTRFEGMDLAELAHHQQWSMERLQEHLLKEGIIQDPNWLDNYLRPEFKKAMVHLVRFSLKNYYKDSSVYELLGVDFMLDTNLNLWFIEANSGPAIKGLPDALVKYAINMARNHFKIEYGLLRSRMKRVIQYVNSLITEKGAISEDENGNVKINNLEQRIKEFEAITRNYFDKEFEIGPDNTWHKLIDENLEGVSRYQGHITQECL